MGICEKSCERYLESASRAWNAEPAQLGRRAACERDTLTGVTIVRPCPSNSQVKKAGSTVRKFMRGEISDYDRVNVALDVIYDFRAAHQLPMTKANNGLRSMIRTEGAQIEVSQRLKRFATIIDKLEREPTLALNSMQDIGGVRAVLADIDEVRRVEARLRRNRTPIGHSDYITNPRASGYRGVHLVVEYDGRAIEVQLRTRVMHEWAITVERLSARMGQNIKQDGDNAVQSLMAIISEAMAIEETGGEVPPALLSEMKRRRLEAAPFLGGAN